jgi:hypothetical protein
MRKVTKNPLGSHHACQNQKGNLIGKSRSERQSVTRRMIIFGTVKNNAKWLYRDRLIFLVLSQKKEKIMIDFTRYFNWFHLMPNQIIFFNKIKKN